VSCGFIAEPDGVGQCPTPTNSRARTAPRCPAQTGTLIVALGRPRVPGGELGRHRSHHGTLLGGRRTPSRLAPVPAVHADETAVGCGFVQSVPGGVGVPNGSRTRFVVVSSVVGLLLVVFGFPASATPPSHGSASVGRVLFVHVAPDGSRVVARTATCTQTKMSYLACGSSKSGQSATEFDVSVHGHDFRVAVLDSYRADICRESGVMNPMFTSPLSAQGDHEDGLIALCVHSPVARVVLPAPSAHGPVPRGDRMKPVDGWVVFPYHNFNSVDRPQALDQQGKRIGSSLPVPCC